MAARGATSAKAALVLCTCALAACGSAAVGAHPSKTALTAQRVRSLLTRYHVAGPHPAPDGARRAHEALRRAFDRDGHCAVGASEADLVERLGRGDLSPVRRVAVTCLGRPPAPAELRRAGLDALAKAFDEDSAYLTVSQLASLRAEVHDPADERALARGRLLSPGQEAIALIELPSFYLHSDGRSASRDVRYLIEQLRRQGAFSVLLDLRGNRGGVVEEAVRLSAALGVSGPIARVRRREWGDTLRELRAEPDAESYQGPLWVLTGPDTAGVAEVFAAAMKDRGRAHLAGATTRGHGSAQRLVLLQSPKGASAGAVRVTDRMFYRLDGSPIESHGIAPDVVHALEDDEALQGLVREQ